MVQTRAGSRAASEACETPTREAALPAPASLPAARLQTQTDTPTKSSAARVRTPRRSLAKSFTPTLDSPRETREGVTSATKAKSKPNGNGRKNEPTPSAGGASARRRARQKDRIRALKACPAIVEEEDAGLKGVLEGLLSEGEGEVCLSRVAREAAAREDGGEEGWEELIPRVRGVVLAGVREGRYVVDGNGTRVGRA